MSAKQNKILVSYTIENQGFGGGKLMYVAGRENAGDGNLGTIVLPMPAEDVEIDPEVPDPVVFSYSNTQGNVVRLREVLVKIDSDAGNLSTCTLTVLVPEVEDNWVPMTKDVTLVQKSSGNPVALRNPHGLAQMGDYLYFIDYDNHLIVIVSKDELENAAQGAALQVDVCDLTTVFIGDPNARGQAIIALKGQIYALFISTDLETAEDHAAGYLVRLNVGSGGTLTLDGSVRVGKNPQSIIPVTDGSGADQLLIPAIGGEQLYNGTTNGTDSNICVMPALGTWSGTAPVKITGDAVNPPPADPTYDIHAVGAAMRNGSSQVYILTQVYNNQAKSAYWTLYQTSVTTFLGIGNNTPLSVAKTIAGFEQLDTGVMVPPSEELVADDMYFWDILYEQTPKTENDSEDRLWLVLGSPFLITKASAEKYGSPSAPVANPFMMFSCIGGVNVNSVDLTIETLHQAQREVSLKRGVRSSRLATATARAARSAVSTSSPSAEEGEESESK
jgi:hypothetical protein